MRSDVEVYDGSGNFVDGIQSLKFVTSVDEFPKLEIVTLVENFELEISEENVKKTFPVTCSGSIVDAVLGFSKQGLSAEEIKQEMQDVAILTKISGSEVKTSIVGLTAVIDRYNQKEANRRIKDAVMQILKEEKRLGGILKN